MTRAPRDLIALSDGTGNSASKLSKTNVWRLYQALNLRDGSQVAVFGDGVGNSSISVLRVLGLALGIGVKRNVLNLYKFLCHNYWREEDEKTKENKDGTIGEETKKKHDRIWMFGFSRGAFTIRLLAGLVHSEGLVTFETEADLDRNAIAAYRAYRKKCFPAKARWVFWVPLGRWIRDKLIAGWQLITGGTPYELVQRRENIEIHFIGVWDTVVAYGLPIDELTIAVDKWVWPMKFEDTSLLKRVQHARHALALDDERRTFHPVPWDEKAEREFQEELEKKVKQGQKRPVPADRLLQVWFPGMHADVGGGYPDDGLSFVPLCWMIDEAAKQGLKFEEPIVQTYRSLASPTGRLYDSRGGITGALWRYQPRNVQFLMDKNDDTVPKDQRVTPLVHHCAVTRMTYGNDGYAPKALPFKIDILLPDNDRVSFDKNAVAAKLATATDDETKAVLTDLKTLIETTSAADKRGYLFALVLDTIWLRRCVYFVTLGLALIVLALPAIYSLFDWWDKTGKINQITGGAIHYLLNLFKGFIPSYANPWLDAVSANPPLAVNIVLAFIVSLVISKFLELRIKDRARAAWNVQPKVGDDTIDRMRLAGQRHILAAAAVVFAVVALSSFGNWWSFGVALVLAVWCAFLVYRRRNEPVRIDPVKPRFPLSFARKARNSPTAVWLYRGFARTILPALFILIVAWVALCAANLGLYNARSTNGAFCVATITPKVDDERKLFAQHDRLGSATIDISNPCHPTGLWLVAGRQYRIQVEPGRVDGDSGTEADRRPENAWFDKGTPADVAGFGTSSLNHVAAALWRRWWRESWFQPIARVGDIGNYEYPLRSAVPLPKVDFSACAKITQDASPNDTRSPVPLTARVTELACEANNKILRNPALISDITPDSTGELFIYVNDAVFFWDGVDDHRFYKNNSGKAKVTVTRMLAPGAVDAKPDTTFGPAPQK